MHPLLGSGTAVALLLLSVLVGSPQDKKKPAAPPAEVRGAKLPAPPQDKPAPRLPPVLAPAHSAIERRDLIQEFRARHPIMGTYRLRQMMGPGGKMVVGSRGYLMIGQRHLSLHLYAPSTPDHAHLQAVFRTYKIAGERLVTSTLIGHRNRDNGDIALEPVGFNSVLRFRLTGAVLRIYRTPREYLDFERIE